MLPADTLPSPAIGSVADARWADALIAVAAVWLLTMLAGPIDSLAPGTGLAAMLLSLGVFALFRASLDQHAVMRVALIAGAVIGAAVLQSHGLGVLAHRSPAYEATLRQVAIFGANTLLFHLACRCRRRIREDHGAGHRRSADDRAELEMLRRSLSPHFLFNTLNMLSGMVVTGRNADAERAIERLSGFLRASLRAAGTEPIRLADELALLDDFLGIEEARFGARLMVEVRCTVDESIVRVPPLLLQPLVEAAVAEGVEPSCAPVRLLITADAENEALVLRIRDDSTVAVERRSAVARLALAEVHARFRAIHPAARADFTAEPGSFTVTLTLPLHG